MRRVSIYHWGIQNPSIEVRQTTQWPKESTNNDLQNTTSKTKDRETRTSPKSSGLALHLQATESYMLDPPFDKGDSLRESNSSLRKVYNKTNANIIAWW